MKAQRKKRTKRPALKALKPVRSVRAKVTTRRAKTGEKSGEAVPRIVKPIDAPRTVTLSSRASLLAAMVVVTGAAILAARGGSELAEHAGNDVRVEAAAAPEAPAPPESFVLMPEPAAAPAPSAIAPQARAAERVAAKAAVPEAKAAVEEAPMPPAAAPEAAPVVAVAAGPVPAAETPGATTSVSGCLTFDDGTYRLKDATGAEAPKSRSWKSGFLTRRAVTIDIVDAGQSLSLQSHVGRRVEIGGTLLEREMRANSLHRLADSCKK
jgi:hypothetical protein